MGNNDGGKRVSEANPLERLVSWWRLRQARRAAKKYGLDFEVWCVFDYQLKPYGYPGSGQLCEVAMKSGKTAIYRAEITEFWPGNTGQKSWRFEFQGYKSANDGGNASHDKA